jgi:hypothetical protein
MVLVKVPQSKKNLFRSYIATYVKVPLGFFVNPKGLDWL